MISRDELYYLNLLQKHIDNQLSKDEEIEFEQYILQDEHKRILLQIMEKQDENDHLEASIIYEKSRPNDLIFQNQTKSNVIKLDHSYFKNAIAIAVIFIFGLFTYNFYRSNEKSNDWKIYTTTSGEKKIIKLVDGSEVRLNNESELKIKKGFGKKNRVLEFKGEGYFNIHKNEALPLTIKTKHAEVYVLGTTFNLRTVPEENQTITSLIKGVVKVKVNNNNYKDEYMLQPGKKLIITQNDNNIDVPNKQHNISKAIKDNNIKDIEIKGLDIIDKEISEISWINNRIALNNNNILYLSKQMEKIFDVPIVILSEDLKNQNITGVFDETNVRDILNIVKRMGINLNYYTKNDTLYVK